MEMVNPTEALERLEFKTDTTVEELFKVYTVKDAVRNTLFRGSIQQTIVFLEGFLAASKLYCPDGYKGSASLSEANWEVGRVPTTSRKRGEEVGRNCAGTSPK